MNGIAIRPFEEEALFNPALIALLTHRAAKGHLERSDAGLPPILPYLLIPLVLYEPTRKALPRSARAQMGEWIAANPTELVGLPERSRALRSFVSAGLSFGLTHGVLKSENRLVYAAALKRRRPGMARSDEVDECLERAVFLGRWFSGQPDPFTALALWGLRP